MADAQRIASVRELARLNLGALKPGAGAVTGPAAHGPPPGDEITSPAPPDPFLRIPLAPDVQGADWDIFGELDRIRVPTLVLGEEFDECVPAHLADIADRIPDAEHMTQPGAAHMGYLEEPPLRRAYVGLIRDYMARVEARTHQSPPESA
ncbi:hypothetical protein ACFXDF_02425 [Streptomyces sp. NPDC059426]|uniref:hypothetical protein n=1 Tax=Streptomyces sp. NPDC059426 TaxID=3346827 RepID=UPI00367AB351